MAFGGRRADRVEASLCRAAAEILARGELPLDLPTFITVSGAKVSDDLRNCTLFISAFTDDPALLQATVDRFDQLTGLLRHRLSQVVPMKYSPRLRLELDQSSARGSKVSNDLARLVSEADDRESKH